MLHHACSFAAMVNDCFGISNNFTNKDNKNNENLNFEIEPVIFLIKTIS